MFVEKVRHSHYHHKMRGLYDKYLPFKEKIVLNEKLILFSNFKSPLSLIYLIQRFSSFVSPLKKYDCSNLIVRAIYGNKKKSLGAKSGEYVNLAMATTQVSTHVLSLWNRIFSKRNANVFFLQYG